MGEIAEWKMVTTTLLRILVAFFAHPSPDTGIKHNIKETSSRGNILGPFNIPKGKSLGGR